jgi:hypothetical protein
LLLRYGLVDRLELRLGWNYEIGGSGNEGSGSGRSDTGELPEGNSESTEGTVARDSRLTYGVKARVTEQSAWLPESALILAGQTPTSGAATTTTGGAASVFGWELPNEWRFDAAVRYSTAVEEEDHFNVWSPSAVVRVPLDERRTVHVECFGAFSSGKTENNRNHYLSAGASDLVTPDLGGRGPGRVGPERRGRPRVHQRRRWLSVLSRVHF